MMKNMYDEGDENMKKIIGDSGIGREITMEIS